MNRLQAMSEMMQVVKNRSHMTVDVNLNLTKFHFFPFDPSHH
jgi:hypothetical protein